MFPVSLSNNNFLNMYVTNLRIYDPNVVLNPLFYKHLYAL